MNLLAHALLAGPSAEARVGQILADYIPAREIDALPEGIRAGVRAHQKIDVFTDSHAVVGRSKRRMEPPFRRYAAVLVDLFYDHYLAASWDRLGGGQPLREFTAGVYRNLYDHEALLPERLRRVLPSMAGHDWLAAYATTGGVERALRGVSRRLSRANPMGEAGSVLAANYGELEADFGEIFPELREFAGELSVGGVVLR